MLFETQKCVRDKTSCDIINERIHINITKKNI